MFTLKRVFLKNILKHAIFDPWFYSLNGTPGSFVKGVSNIDLNSQRNSTRVEHKQYAT
jgi:hypothetical protein